LRKIPRSLEEKILRTLLGGISYRATAEKYNVKGDHLALCKAMGRAIEKILERHLTTNAGAAIAAVALDMGFDWKMVHGFNSMSRSAGLTAHAYEEMERERPFRAVKKERVLYDGQPEREFKRPE